MKKLKFNLKVLPIMYTNNSFPFKNVNLFEKEFEFCYWKPFQQPFFGKF